jgi:hypothetical protein
MAGQHAIVLTGERPRGSPLGRARGSFSVLAVSRGRRSPAPPARRRWWLAWNVIVPGHLLVLTRERRLGREPVLMFIELSAAAAAALPVDPGLHRPAVRAVAGDFCALFVPVLPARPWIATRPFLTW